MRRLPLFFSILLFAFSSLSYAKTILVVGDSLSAEYGLARGTGWVALAEQSLKAEAPNLKMINASISGETTAGGATRIAALLQTHKPNIVVIELGGNDALRALPVNQTQANLHAMTKQAKAAGAKVLLLGMKMPPNYGANYAAQFEGAYRAVAHSHKATLVPFFLEKIALQRDYFQADGIHPTAAAQPLMRDAALPALKTLLK